MKISEQYLTPLTSIGVIVLHIGLVLALLITQPKKEKTAPMVEIEFVDIDALLPLTTQPVETEQDKEVVPVTSDASLKPHQLKPQAQSKPQPQTKPTQVQAQPQLNTQPKKTETRVEPQPQPQPQTESKAQLDPVIDESEPVEHIVPKPEIDNLTDMVNSHSTVTHTLTSPDNSTLSSPQPNPQANSPSTHVAHTNAQNDHTQHPATHTGGQSTQGTPKNDNSEPAVSGVGSSASQPIKATGAIARPAYPEISEENEEEGTVVLTVLVSPSGKVEKVSIKKSSGFRRLDNAALEAARVGKFKASAWTEYNVPVTFEL